MDLSSQVENINFDLTKQADSICTEIYNIVEEAELVQDPISTAYSFLF